MKVITRLICMIILFFIVSPVNADEIIRGHYCYTYGDKESLKEARDLTRTLAIRNAIESYRVYIESTTTVTNLSLSSNIIQIISSGYLKKMKVVDHTEEGRTICDTIEFMVSPREIEQVIKREVKKRTSKVEEKGIGNNGFVKILRVEESEPKRDKDGDLYKNITVRAKIIRKVHRDDEHLFMFMTKYDHNGEEQYTLRYKFHSDDSIMYPGEIVTYYFFKVWESEASSYRLWLYDDNKPDAASEPKKSTKKRY